MGAFHLPEFLPYQIAVLAAELSKEFAALYGDRFGLSVSEWRVLAHLHDAEEASVRDIAARAHMEKSRVSRAAARLEARGLLTRESRGDDGRLLRLRLAPEGTRLLKELLPLAMEFERDVLRRLTHAPSFRAGLEDLLERAAKGPTGGG